ncbi:extensin [Drosophila novamexicana]|uniref:extensin n=1 Tax=Drosophila novamexicana TaxID=47314 RepID=UPI0011E5D2ED|nr:extensin [Drosophila novamexicana]
MHNSWSCLMAALLCVCIAWQAGCTQARQPDGMVGMSNSIAAPGQPLYYLMADAGSTVGPNDELKRTNRSLMKWWEDLFGPSNCCNNNNLLNNNNNFPNNNNYNNNWLYNNNLAPAIPAINNNNCNGLQLQSLDPFKQMKLFKKLPDLWGNNFAGPCAGQCGGGVQLLPQPVNNYAAPPSPGPGYGGEGYAPPQPQPAVPTAPVDYNPAPAPPSSGYETPNPSYDGPGDGDAGYVEPTAPPSVDYEAPAPAPPAASYETPDTPEPTYDTVPSPAPESYSKVEEYAQPAKSYTQPPQIVYQPIIYLYPTAQAPAPAQVYAAPPAPAPVYAAPPAPQPAPVYAAPPAAPPAPTYASSSCRTPIRLSLIDQPYRVAPELFQEYNYRLALAEQNRL